ncbi:MAG: 3-hydroxylacyl-ACP dehydratase [Treponema sp.]|jgi:predicted hotdog family 3-hydroxylacyl-ACP dehydratase|nr:3-hydroxylacyl-ACP dehydratase [Treponema sp.]
MMETDLPSIVPHRGRMLLLSKITGYNLEERSLEAEFHITESCLFYDPAIGGVPSWVGFEFIAQAIAALSGIREREKCVPAALASSVKPRIGFILSVSKMQVFLPILKSGSTVVIKVKELDCMDMVYNFDGQIFLEGMKALEGTLAVMKRDVSVRQ